MSVSTLDDLIAPNERYSHEHTPFPTFKETIDLGYPIPKTVIICCADFRSNAENFLKLDKSMLYYF